jgi:uncharacterized protein
VIYLDANVIIRLLEGDAQTRQTLAARLRNLQGGYVTSELSRLECRCRPLKQGDAALLQLYDAFFAATDIHVTAIDRTIIDKATDLRASTKLRTPDALHLATAMVQQASTFCTGDRNFAGISHLTVEIL